MEFSGTPPPSPQHENNLLHLTPAASVVIVFCGLGASISFMGVLSLYLWWCGVDPLGNTTNSRSEAEADEHNKALREQLSKRVLEKLPVLQYQSLLEMKGSRDNIECCAVCLSDFQDLGDADEATRIRLLPGCSHYFHTECIQLWLCSYHTCPLCRSSLMVQAVVDAAHEDANRLRELLAHRDESGDLRQIVIAPANSISSSRRSSFRTSVSNEMTTITTGESGRYIVSLPMVDRGSSFMGGGSGRIVPLPASEYSHKSDTAQQ